MTGTLGPAVDRGLRRERLGWYSYDWANSVFSTTVVTVFLAPYLTSVARNAADSSGHIHPLGISVPPGSFFGYVLSVATLLQVLVLPVTGAVADRSRHKRRLLGVLAGLGALCTTALFLVAGDHYLAGALLFLAANLCYGASIVVYYSWLPDLSGPDERDAVSSRDQVDQLAELVDGSRVDVYAFGLTTDFRARLFPGTQRLLELADDVQRVQVEVLCWCGLPGLLNARVVDGAMVREGATVVVADTAPPPPAGGRAAADVRYQVLCRRHHVRASSAPPSPVRGSWPSAEPPLTRPGGRWWGRSPPMR